VEAQQSSVQKEREFEKLIDKLAETSHGSQEFIAIKKFLQTQIAKTEGRKKFLLPKLTQNAILWDEIKAKVWNSQEDQENNRFPFLQGDIIQTSMVYALASAESTQKHDLWIVLSPDCDCVRSRYIRVASVFPVYIGENENKLSTQRFNEALKFATHRFFPLPTLEGDIDEFLIGYFVDIETPYYIANEYKDIATPCASLTLAGWHLLNGVLQEKDTRAANIAEATKIRSTFID
jgi:hypothetical protein